MTYESAPMHTPEDNQRNKTPILDTFTSKLSAIEVEQNVLDEFLEALPTALSQALDRELITDTPNFTDDDILFIYNHTKQNNPDEAITSAHITEAIKMRYQDTEAG